MKALCMQVGAWGPVNVYFCVCATVCVCVRQRVYTGYDGFE